MMAQMDDDTMLALSQGGQLYGKRLSHARQRRRARHTPNFPETTVGSFTLLQMEGTDAKPGLADAKTGKHASEAKKQWKTH
eukprot:m.189372 g.189372  ORF g.189372 m.189372 type:complete len:81 (+) comp16938_c1_seq56:2650-2892(+)